MNFPPFRYEVVTAFLSSIGYRPYGHRDNLHEWSNGEELISFPEGMAMIPGFHIGLILKKTKKQLMDIQMFDPM